MKTAIEILDKGAQHMRDRAKTYDNESGEHSIPAVVDAFKAVTGVEMTYEQGWLFMALVKLVRSQQGEYKRDNYEDGAAYMALAGEQRESGVCFKAFDRKDAQGVFDSIKAGSRNGK